MTVLNCLIELNQSHRPDQARLEEKEKKEKTRKRGKREKEEKAKSKKKGSIHKDRFHQGFVYVSLLKLMILRLRLSLRLSFSVVL